MKTCMVLLIIEQAELCLMVKPTVENLGRNIGQKVFYVTALGPKTFMQEATITGAPQQHSNIGLFLPVQIAYDWGKYDGFWSLKDCNVIPNDYNPHQLFYCKQCAKNYVKKCKAENIGYIHRYIDYIPSFCS